MGEELEKLQDATWLDDRRGVAYLQDDWIYKTKHPPLFIEPGSSELKTIERAPLEEYGKLAGYFVRGATLCFFLWPPHFPNLEWGEKSIFVVGDFNGWADAIGNGDWQLRPTFYEGKPCFKLELPVRKVCPRKSDVVCFKFVTADKEWQPVPLDAPNRDDSEAHNFVLDTRRTGNHVFYFEPRQRHPILGHERLVWKDKKREEKLTIAYGHLLADRHSLGALGSFIERGETVFRLFAPRATAVRVTFFQSLNESTEQTHDLLRLDDDVWEKVYPRDLHGWYYYYTVEGENVDNSTHFDSNFRILDPYALACVNGRGPGIILDRRRLPLARNDFKVPHWHDLVIMETHVRDLAAKAPLPMSPQERRGFAGVAKWLRSDDCYLKDLGINAVELQPIQENDAPDLNAYHWGYMTCNFFSPASQYGTKPEDAAQVAEFKDMVDAFHEQGLAVILDVVYNHVGEPAHLLFVDKEYYFEVTPKGGHLMNFSGCGNDFKTHTPMGLRLTIDSLVHLVETYGVDGFRFDLAELLGVDTLRAIETALKKVKPGIILIAEPWSFRGHIAQALRHTGWASWNDGYREFTSQYVRGQGTRDTFKYFLSGSPHYFAMFPAQTINYTESHDDRCWLDRITENREHNGSWPTLNDRRRTHLMCAFLFASLGVPMISEGQDFLRSKQGVNNTYQRGDLNALDYQRMRLFPMTHEYFKRWIQFRLSPQGHLLRLDKRQSDHYLRFFEYGDTSAIACLYNDDHSHGREQLFFAINPHHYAFELPVEGVDPRPFKQIADHERFQPHGLEKPTFVWQDGKLTLPPMSCGLWVKH